MYRRGETLATSAHAVEVHILVRMKKWFKVSAAAPMDLIAIDIFSGLPQATNGSTCIIVAVDYMTKWDEAYALPNEEASTCMDALYNGFFARFGISNQIHCDQGRNFESKLFTELTRIAGIRKTRTTPFHPRSDGQTCSIVPRSSLESRHRWTVVHSTDIKRAKN